jgi:tetratricopeptide (TPR) repeat protein
MNPCTNTSMTDGFSLESNKSIPDQILEYFGKAQNAGNKGCWEQSIHLYARVIEHQPDSVQAYNNMGDAYRNMGKYDAAIKCFHKALECDQDIAAIHYNLGSTYRLVEQFDPAFHHLSRAVELQPDYAHAWTNLALIFKEKGAFDRALNCLDRAVSLAPELAEARWNRAAVLLLKGQHHQGWRDYEWRFKIGQYRSIYPHRLEGSRWDGRHVPGKTILVHDEQGLGDTIQFVRYLPLVRQRCGRVVLETRRELVHLLSCCNSIDEIVVRSSIPRPAPLYDHYIPLMSLPTVFDTMPNGPTECVPYIKAPQSRVDHWQKLLPSKKLKVGIVWAGRPEHANDANRSCPPNNLEPLFQMKGIEFVGLQKGETEKDIGNIGYDGFFNWGEQLHDFTDTAGLIANLDVLVTVDTSVAHLAGAMGRPVWLMLPYVSDWRWLASGSRTPWYPTMRLYRQPRPKDWPSVVTNLKSSLTFLSASKGY